MRKSVSSFSFTTLALAMVLAAVTSTPVARAAITYGTLDNFDVINDTGGETHGFEIELEGIQSSDVAYTFGAPYQRYGDPAIVPTATGVIIRYAASWDAVQGWSATTPYTQPPYLPTQGHSCWTGGVSDPALYYADGCDHFGASLNATPTKTTYRWLVQSGPGTLAPFGTNVSLPAPVWNVTPPAVPGAQPIAAAAIAPPAPGAYEFGDALWAKVFVTELPDAVRAEDLDHMVIDDPVVNIVPSEPAEVEIEWVLLQASTGNDGEQEFGAGIEVGAGNEAVSRRFEFYRYAGYYDPETHEATCDNPLEAAQQTPDRCGDPDQNGLAGVGDLIGAQNIAINLGGILPPANHAPVAVDDAVTTSEDVAVTIAEATLTGNDTDSDNDALTVFSVQSAVNGTVVLSNGSAIFTPSADVNGQGSFAYTASDGNGGTSSARVFVTITAVDDPPVADAGPDQTVKMKDTVQLDGGGSWDVDSSSLTFSWSFASPVRGKQDLTNPATATPTFVASKKGTYVLTLSVSDGTTARTDTVTITVTGGK